MSSVCAAVEKPYIISGFDDVLRQAENTGLLKASLQIFEKDKTFVGSAVFCTLQFQTGFESEVRGI